MSDDDVIKLLYHIIDTIKGYHQIIDHPKKCSSCGNNECECMPDPGQLMRFNCPLWKSKECINE